MSSQKCSVWVFFPGEKHAVTSKSKSLLPGPLATLQSEPWWTHFSSPETSPHMPDMSCHEELSLTHLPGAPLSSRAALSSLAREILFAKAVNSCYRFWSQIFILIRDGLVPCHFCYIYWYNKANVWKGVFLKYFASMRIADLALHHIKLLVKCIIRTGQNPGQSSCLASSDGWHIPTVCEQRSSFQAEKLLISKSRISDLTTWIIDGNGSHLIFVPNISLINLIL